MIGEAVRIGTEQVSTELVGGNTKLETGGLRWKASWRPYESRVVVLNVGAKSGLKVGERLSIERVSREIKDPATNQVIRRLSSQIGQIEIIELDDVSAVAKIINGTDFKVGDLAKTVTNWADQSRARTRGIVRYAVVVPCGHIRSRRSPG